MNADDVLKNACYITLAKRPERDKNFQARYKAATGKKAKRVYGFDGERLPIPTGWKTTRGAFGACLAHIAAWGYALTNAAEVTPTTPFCFFEDDAIFCDDFLTKLDAAAKLVPNNWDMFYLGGEHLIGARPRPRVIAEDSESGVKIAKCYNVNRLHAYVVKASAFEVIMPRLLQYCVNAPLKYGPSGGETCFDYELGRAMEEGKITVYSVAPFLCGQGGEGSDTYPSKSKFAEEDRFFQLDAELYM